MHIVKVVRYNLPEVLRWNKKTILKLALSHLQVVTSPVKKDFPYRQNFDIPGQCGLIIPSDDITIFNSE